MSRCADDFAITLDIDWAPDCAIDFCAKALIERRVCATWFVTHDSPAILRLREHADLFELGIHPNFLPGSTHGDTPEKIYRHIKDLCPDARTMRTHALVQSSVLLRMAQDFGIRTDVSLFLPGQDHLKPHRLFLSETQAPLVRVPYVWEDDTNAAEVKPAWNIAAERFTRPGLKVFDFHPIHVYLNMSSMRGYQRIKQLGPLQQLRAEQLEKFRSADPGTLNVFNDMVVQIATKQKQSWRIDDIVREWELSPCA